MPTHSVQIARVTIDAAREANVSTLAPDEFIQAEAYLRIAYRAHDMKNSRLAVTYAQLAIDQVDAARRIAMQHTPSPGTTDNDLAG